MPTPEDGAHEIQHFLSGLNAPKHAARKKAIDGFREFIAAHGCEFYDDDVDQLFVGDGWRQGLCQWCGERSTGTQGALKRTAAVAISLIKWLVTLPDPNGEENVFLSRFLQLNVEDLQKMQLDMHILPPVSSGSRAANRSGSSEEACELVSMLLQGRSGAAGSGEEAGEDGAGELELSDLLPGKAAQEIFIEWLKRAPANKQSPMRLNAAAAASARRSSLATQEEDSKEPRTAAAAAAAELAAAAAAAAAGLQAETWAEVDLAQFERVDDPLRGAAVQVVEQVTIDEPIPDPLGLKNADLRVYQRTLMSEDADAELAHLYEEANAAARGGASAEAQNKGKKRRGGLGQKERLRLLQKVQVNKKMLQARLLGKKPSKKTRSSAAGTPTDSTKGGRNNNKNNNAADLSANNSHDPNANGEDSETEVEAAGGAEGLAAKATAGYGGFGVLPTEESFEPALFLSVVHPDVTFSDLRRGVERLSQVEANQAEQLQHLVRDHFDNFVRCADSIEKYANQIDSELGKTEEVERKRRQEEEEAVRRMSLGKTGTALVRAQLQAERSAASESARAAAAAAAAAAGRDNTYVSAPAVAKSHLKDLTRLVTEAQTEASKSFANMLDKLDRIKQVRAAQHLLREKGAVLDIPSEMRTCLREARYRDLVTLYNKAHSTYSSRILQQVKAEAQAVAQRACVRLVETLKSPEYTLEEQLQAMQRLAELEYNGEDPLGLCFAAQREHFQRNLEQCRESFLASLLDAYNDADQSSRRGRHRPTNSNLNGNFNLNNQNSSVTAVTANFGLFLATDRSNTSNSERDLTDLEDLTPVGVQQEQSFFDERTAGAESDSDAGESMGAGLDGDDRSDASGDYGLGDDPDEFTLPCPPGIDPLTHAVFLGRLQHTSNIAWCLSSWLPHISALAVLLSRMNDGGHSSNNRADGSAPSPRKSIRLLFRPSMTRATAASGGVGGYMAGISEDDSDWRGMQESPSGTSISDAESNRRSNAAEVRLAAAFRSWLSKSVLVLRKAIFGVAATVPSASAVLDSANAYESSRRSSTTAGSSSGHTNANLASNDPAAANNNNNNNEDEEDQYSNDAEIDEDYVNASAHPALALALKHDKHLKLPLPPRYLRRTFASLANLYQRLMEAATESWEGEAFLLPGVRQVEQLIRDAQALYIDAEMSALISDASHLHTSEAWLPAEPPDAAGGTRLPRQFAKLVAQRTNDLNTLLPRPEWSGNEVSLGLANALTALLDGFTQLSEAAYEASRIKGAPTGAGASAAIGMGAALAAVAAAAPGDAQSPTRQLLYIIGNCLQLDDAILPELWEAAAGEFQADKARMLQKEKDRVKDVQNAVLTKYLKRKYRELKLYVRNGWYSYVKPAPLLLNNPSNNPRNPGLNRQASIDSVGDDVAPSEGVGRINSSHRRNISASVEQQRQSLGARRMSRGRRQLPASPRAGKGPSGASPPRGQPQHPNNPNNPISGSQQQRSMSLPSYIVKVLLSLVQTRLEATETLHSLCYVRRGDGRKDILYADYVLRESARQVMEIVCDCANARVLGKESMGSKKLDGSDPLEQAEKIAQVELLRDTLWRFLPSATVERIDRVVSRLHAGKWTAQLQQQAGSGGGGGGGASGELGSRRGSMERAAEAGLRGGKADGPAGIGNSERVTAAATMSRKDSASGKPTSVSDSLAASMPGKFLTASDLQELARVYVVCLR